MSLTLAWQDLRGSVRKLWLPALCATAAVGAGTSVKLFSSQLKASISQQTRSSLGADLEITSSHLLSAQENELIRSTVPKGTQTTLIREFVSMAQNPNPSTKSSRTLMVEVRSVGSGFPFYGQYEFDPPTVKSFEELHTSPVPLFFAQPSLGSRLGLHLGQKLKIGETEFVLGAWVKEEPGFSMSPFQAGPKLWISENALEKTGLSQKGSRIRIRTLIALPKNHTDNSANNKEADFLRDELEHRLIGFSGQILTFKEANPQLREFYRRIMSFLELLAVLVYLLSGLGIAQSFRNHIRSRAPEIAILRCLGASLFRVLSIYLFELAMIAAVGCILGCFTGVLLFSALRLTFQEILPTAIGVTKPLVASAILPGLVGFFICLLFGVWGLLDVPSYRPLQLLRGDNLKGEGKLRKLVWGTGLALLLFWILALELDNLSSASYMMGGLFTLSSAIWLISFTLIKFLSRLGTQLMPFFIQHSLRSLARTASETALSATVLTFGALLISSLLYLRTTIQDELLVPNQATRPSLFLIDIGEDQKAGVANLLSDFKPSHVQWAKWVKAVLNEVNGKAFQPQSFTKSHELNLSERQELYPSEKTVAGSFWSGAYKGEETVAVSLEKTYAERNGFNLGDTLRLDIQGVPVSGKIVHLRTVKWSDFQPNFFFLFQNGSLAGAPATWIASVTLEKALTRTSLQEELIRRYPNITVIDVSEVSGKIFTFIEKIAVLLEGIGLFAIFSGLLILALVAIENARRRGPEIALLKVLGATRRQIFAMIGFEFAWLALLSSLLGTTSGFLISWLSLYPGFKITPSWFNPTVLIMMGGFFVLIIGTALTFSRRIFQVKPLQLLKT